MLIAAAALGCSQAQGDAHVANESAVAARETPLTGDTGTATTASMVADTGVDFYTAAELSRTATQIARGTSTATVFARHPDRYYVEARRVASGTPEVHDDYSDVTFVQAGRAMLHTGAAVRGSHIESAGEHRGGAIDGGTRRPIATGDFFVIPAGTPHQYELADGDSIRYLTVKVRKPR